MFFLDIALASSLGLGVRSDSLYAAWSFPTMVGRGAFQSLTNSLMGFFADDKNKDIDYSYALTVVGVLSLFLTVILGVTSGLWFPLSMPGATIEIHTIGTPLAAILSLLVTLMALAEAQRAIYYRIGKNYIPSAARILGTIVSVIVVIVASTSQDLVVVAWGLVIGTAAEMLCSFLGLLIIGHRFRFSWPPNDTLQEMVRVVGLPLVGQVVLIGASFLERAIASYLAPGSVTAVSYANRIIQILERFVFRGFVITTIQNYMANIQPRWRQDIRVLFLIAVPLMVILVVLPVPLMSILFERGRFTPEATRMVALALQTYALAVPIVSVNRIPYALAFAQNRSRLILIFYILFASALIGSELIFLSLGADIRSFGLGYVVAVSAGTIYLYYHILPTTTSLRASLREAFQLIGVLLFVLVGTSLITIAVQSLVIGLPIADWVLLIAGSASCIVLLFLAIRIFRLPEGMQLHLLRRG